MCVSRPLALWIAAVAIFLALRISLGQLGETLCTGLLIIATSIRFGYGRKANDAAAAAPAAPAPAPAPALASDPGSMNDASDERGNELLLPDTVPDVDEPAHFPTNAVIAATRTPVTRFAFLDNVKVFLTALVVTHHVNCAFGVCGDSWYLVVGRGGPETFTRFLGIFTVLDQSFFMPLFFFISAYFVPSSYTRKGWYKFREGRKMRILIPATFSLLVISPACIALGGYVAGVEKLTYIPSTGVAWFLYWLLLFNWMYVTMAVKIEAEAGISTPMERQKFPGTISRLLCGIGVCGFLLLPFLVLKPGSLAAMPISTGSVTCDFLMFYLGIQAKKNGWLELSLSDQMDIHPILLLFMVVAEGTGVALLLQIVAENELAGLGLVCLAGIFCLDMSLLVLVTFQNYFNNETSMTKFLARASYGVYLLHPIVVTGMTALYIKICNQLELANIDPVAIGSAGEETPPVGTNSDYHYPVGWVLVNLASHIVIWPFAYGATRLPVLKNIL